MAVVWWYGWCRLDSKRTGPFAYIPNSGYRSYDECMRALECRFKGELCTLVALPENETPSHGGLPYAPDRGIPYAIVQASENIGLFRPQDFTWLHLGYDANWTPLPVDEVNWCRCKAVMPKLCKYRFTWSDGKESVYAVGQCLKCGRCHYKQCR